MGKAGGFIDLIKVNVNIRVGRHPSARQKYLSIVLRIDIRHFLNSIFNCANKFTLFTPRSALDFAD